MSSHTAASSPAVTFVTEMYEVAGSWPHGVSCLRRRFESVGTTVLLRGRALQPRVTRHRPPVPAPAVLIAERDDSRMEGRRSVKESEGRGRADRDRTPDMDPDLLITVRLQRLLDRAVTPEPPSPTRPVYKGLI
ncbi:unnamed protein product [Pleuronectes platessa]|uniref:Uncharacterized protein n=1 Tax=Pleuronectes platessa TaxID=8262 RepID=A0A9N7YSZ4_PLEPL|nr:unnamed protein product [Pleuronectes platessa]